MTTTVNRVYVDADLNAEDGNGNLFEDQVEIFKKILRYKQISIDSDSLEELTRRYVHPDHFYTIEPIQVEIFEACNCESCPVYAACEHCQKPVTLARIVTEEEKPAPGIVPESVCAKCGGVGFYHLGTHTRITCSCLRPASWSSITPERWAEFGQHYKGEPRQPAPVVDKPAAQQVVNYQLCPKCQGQGIVSKPPWVAADVESWTSDRPCHTCDVCNGAKVILPFTQVQQPTEVDNKLLKKWSLAKWGNEEVLMRDGVMVAITWQEIVDELNKLHQQPTEWIPVSRELPKESGQYITIRANGIRALEHWYPGTSEHLWLNCYIVTHYIALSALPEPPKP